MNFIYVLTTTDWDNQTEITLFTSEEKAMAWLDATSRDLARDQEYDEHLLDADLETLLEAMETTYTLEARYLDPSI
mgnify:FL=1